MKALWHAARGELEFTTQRLSGAFVADGSGRPTLCNHRLRALTHRPTGTLVSTDQTPAPMPEFGFSIFRAYTRDGWLTELRANPPTVTPVEDGVQLVWEPTIQHPGRVEATFTIREPNLVDVDLRVHGRAFLPDYELLISNYLAPGFIGGAYVRANDFHDGTPEQIRVADHPAFHGLFNFFPRDERAAHVLTDGRGQRGRWFWRTAIGRLFALPVVFASHGPVDVLMMGRAEDVQAVGLTYAGDETHDGVAGHRGQYLALFGRDLHAGEGWRTQFRLVVDDFHSDPARHLQEWEKFQTLVGPLARSFELTP